jgi:hypothetical protein
MRKAFQLLLAAVWLLPALCNAQTKCPWLTEATARGVLGGPVKATIKLSERHDGSCEFSRQQGDVLLELRISVEVMTDMSKQFPAYLAQCPPKSAPMTAIGNEAISCGIQDHADGYAEKVVGRVREQAFAVTISSSAENDAAMTQKMRVEKVHLVAEQVAGILF